MYQPQGNGRGLDGVANVYFDSIVVIVFFNNRVFIAFFKSRVWELRPDGCHCGELLSSASAFVSVIIENGVCSVGILVSGEFYRHVSLSCNWVLKLL